jgi:lipid-binding SYLF domain-containing protein
MMSYPFTSRVRAGLLVLCACLLACGGCSTTPKSDAGRSNLESDIKLAVRAFTKTDPSMQRFFDNAFGYAVFPSVGKGAVGVGGAFGRGMLIEQGVNMGYCTLSQGTIGFQLGGQEYREIIFFQTQEAIERFKSGKFAFSAQASAVAAASGASADADYEEGVLVFTESRGGLMFEASIGGQKFNYEQRTDGYQADFSRPSTY